MNSSRFFVLAQTENNNPLENTESDPLIPSPEIDRPLTSLEKRLIQEKAIILNDQAKLQLAAGNKNEAFALWYQELKLQRSLGRIEEITALGRVGEIAWQQNLSQELKIISDRLVTLQQTLTKDNKLNSQLLANLGQAYQQVRDIDRAILIYQQILQTSRQKANSQELPKNLETLGQLYLAQFDYTQAANTYEELLKSTQPQQPENSLDGNNYIYKSQTNSNSVREETYLAQLVEIYDKSSELDKAIAVKQKLLEKYLEGQKHKQLTALKISLATDYQTQKQPEQAQKYYEEAFNLAWSLQHLALAEESLQKLALLYQESQQPLAALEIYQELIKIHQKTYNYYDLMNTYAQIGKIYQQIDNDQQALIAYQKGLKLAESFDYSVDYFQSAIDQLNK